MIPGSFHESLISIAALFYSIVMIGLIVGLMRLRRTSRLSSSKPHSRRTPLVSIIVAARNEEKNLDRLLTQLTRQSYPEYEIIIANDRSEDRTKSIIAKWQKRDRRIKRVDIRQTPDGWAPKKHALHDAIERSKGEILCFTDADCVPPLAWVAELVQHFTLKVGVVAGYSPYDESLLQNNLDRSTFWRRLLHQFIRYEEFKGALWSAGSIALRKAWLCTGRNLAYRRKVFDDVGGFARIKHSASGDDDLFLQQVRRTTRWGVVYATTASTHVPTGPPADFRSFLQQRIRHFSAGKYFPFPMKLFFAPFHLTNLLILFYFVLWLIVPGLSYVFLAAFAGKLFVDLLFLFVGGLVLGKGNLNLSFVMMEILYVFYNTFIGPLGFVQQFEWKPGLKS